MLNTTNTTSTTNNTSNTSNGKITSGQTVREWDKYLDLYVEWQQKYANEGYPNQKIALLYEIGKFLELYGVDNGIDKIGNIREIADIVGVKVTQKNNGGGKFNPKNDPMKNDRDHPLFAGWQPTSLEEFESKLIGAGYHIIYYEQSGEIDDDTNKKIRKCTQVVTQATYVGRMDSSDSRHFVSVYIDNATKPSQKLFKWQDAILNIGMTSMDITTNETVVYSVESKETDKTYAINELYRFLQSMNPMEIIITVGNCALNVPLDDITFSDYIKKELSYDKYTNGAHDPITVKKPFTQPDYQNAILNKVYFPGSVVRENMDEHLGIKDHTALVSLCQLLEYIYEKNSNILTCLKLPEIWLQTNYFTLSNNAIEQLSIKSKDSRYKSLLNIIDKTSTAMGHRMLENDLVNPIIDPNRLKTRWQLVELFKKSNNWKIVEKHLDGIKDIVRLYRNLQLRRIHPCDLVVLNSSNRRIAKLFEVLAETDWGEPICLAQEFLDELDTFIDELEDIFDLNTLAEYHTYDINRSLFKKGLFPEIDTLQDSIDAAKVSLEEFEETISGLCKLNASLKTPPVQTLNRNRKNKKQPVKFKMTIPRFQLIELYCQKIKKGHKRIYKWPTYNSFYKWYKVQGDEKNQDDVPQDSLPDSQCLSPQEIDCLKSITNIKIEKTATFQSSAISDESNERMELEARIAVLVKEQYAKCLEKFAEKYSNLMDLLARRVARIDVLKSHAKTATKNAYNKPTILDDPPQESSYLCATGVRHPIVESINLTHKYIPNDVTLGKEDCKGLIIYGSNDSGKTTLMKAIGLNVVLAQIGSYVPSQTFEFMPFHNILTRLSGMDNMYKGQGSFSVEVNELRDITRRCGANSLVLGDELCRGTEHTSAIGIVAGGILYMNEQDTNYVMATHLHDLPNLKEIKEISDRLQIKHLEVKRDPIKNTLEYVRKLKDGPGDAYYGIEVARSQGVSEDILMAAERIRKRLIDLPETLSAFDRSGYNTKKLKTYFCEVCNKNRSEHIHHIAEQETADSNGIIDNQFHKNTVWNQVDLCRQCHDDIHVRKTLVIDGYIKTSEGVELRWKRHEKNANHIDNTAGTDDTESNNDDDKLSEVNGAKGVKRKNSNGLPVLSGRKKKKPKALYKQAYLNY